MDKPWDLSLCKSRLERNDSLYSLNLFVFFPFFFFFFLFVSVFFNPPPCFRRLVDTEDELSDIQSESVPSEVRDWLASTFTRQMGLMLRRNEEKPRFRSIVHAVQAGIFVER